MKFENIDLYKKTLLDLGCGRGRWLSFFEKNFSSIVTGIDLSQRAVEISGSRGFNVCQGSITQLPFEDNSFDFVTSVTVLLHLPYELKEQAVAEISRVLKPKGQVLIIENTWDDPSPHVFSLSVCEWEKVFTKHNLHLIHKSGHCFNLFRMNLPSFLPFRDLFSIYLDYPIDYLLMNYFYGKQSKIALQHLMVFEK